MRKINFLGAAAIVAMLAPAAALASTTFVYDLTSDGGYYKRPGGALTGSITFDGNIGDTVPLLDGAGVTSFQFTLDGFETWNSTSSTLVIQGDSMDFNGMLGASTLNGTSGTWQVFDNNASNIPFYLFGQADTLRYDELWASCYPSSSPSYDACTDFGNSWSLTLASETSDAPEPATAGLVLGGLAVFFVERRLRRKRATA